ncbi:MAG: (Fe-S)-binding protein, partial [Pseudomonadota bacterium]
MSTAHGNLLPFKLRAERALKDNHLKTAIDRTTQTAESRRSAAVDGFPQFAEARIRGRKIKDHVIANLDHYLIEFERNAIASGAVVH